MAFTGKFVYMAHHFILLRINHFDLRVDRERWWFEHSPSQLRVCLSAGDAKNVSWSCLSPLRGQDSLTMAFTGKFVCIYIYIYISDIRIVVHIFSNDLPVIIYLYYCTVISTKTFNGYFYNLYVYILMLHKLYYIILH